MVSYIKEDLRLSKRCGPLQQGKLFEQDVFGCLGGFLGSDEELTRGLTGVMPRGQTRGSTCGWTRGMRPPQCPLQHMCLCSSRGGQAEIIPWSPPMWVSHMSDVYRRATSTKVFCQAMCRFGVCPLTAIFWDP